MTAPASAAAAAPLPTPSASPAAAPLDPFLEACLSRIHDLDQIALVMLWGALLLAFFSGAVALYAAYKAATRQPDTNEMVQGIPAAALEPLGKFLETLSKLPVWFFLFLAGVALAWFASGISDGRCGNPAEAPAPEGKAQGPGVKGSAGAADKGAPSQPAAAEPAAK